jgi:hypothetical protein
MSTMKRTPSTLILAMAGVACGGMDQSFEQAEDEVVVAGPVNIPVDPCTTQNPDAVRFMTSKTTQTSVSPNTGYATRSGCKYWITDFYLFPGDHWPVGFGGIINPLPATRAACESFTSTSYVYKQSASGVFIYQNAGETAGFWVSGQLAFCMGQDAGGMGFTPVQRPVTSFEVYRVAVSAKIGNTPANVLAVGREIIPLDR